jgi:hypothetical protein
VRSPLENLAGPGQPLRKEVPDAKELAGLKQSGLRRLADAENAANSLESRFDLAYNAAHALSLAALRRAGYRSTNPPGRWLATRAGQGGDLWPRRSLPLEVSPPLSPSAACQAVGVFPAPPVRVAKIDRRSRRCLSQCSLWSAGRALF